MALHESSPRRKRVLPFLINEAVVLKNDIVDLGADARNRVKDIHSRQQVTIGKSVT